MLYLSCWRILFWLKCHKCWKNYICTHFWFWPLERLLITIYIAKLWAAPWLFNIQNQLQLYKLIWFSYILIFAVWAIFWKNFLKAPEIKCGFWLAIKRFNCFSHSSCWLNALLTDCVAKWVLILVQFFLPLHYKFCFSALTFLKRLTYGKKKKWCKNFEK